MKEMIDDSTAKSNFTTEGTESTEIRRRRIPEHFLLNPLLSLLLTSVFSVSSVVAILLFAVESLMNKDWVRPDAVSLERNLVQVRR